jgi:hypothetical protein
LLKRFEGMAPRSDAGWQRRGERSLLINHSALDGERHPCAKKGTP